MAEETGGMSSSGNMEGIGCTEEAKQTGMNFLTFRVAHKGLSASSIWDGEVGANETEGIDESRGLAVDVALTRLVCQQYKGCTE
jgi:hypothetical protein